MSSRATQHPLHPPPAASAPRAQPSVTLTWRQLEHPTAVRVEARCELLGTTLTLSARGATIDAARLALFSELMGASSALAVLIAERAPCEWGGEPPLDQGGLRG